MLPEVAAELHTLSPRGITVNHFRYFCLVLLIMV